MTLPMVITPLVASHVGFVMVVATTKGPIALLKNTLLDNGEVHPFVSVT